MTQKLPSIPDPQANVESVRTTAQALKEAVEILLRQRGDRSYSAVTWNDLVALGLITAAQIPPTPTSGR